MPSQPKDAPKKRGPKPGTYYKQTPEVLEKLRQAFAIDATIDEACFYAGIDQSTYHIWKKKEPKQFEQLEQLRNTPILAARQTLATAVKSDAATALKYLERKRRAEFAVRTENDLHVKEMPQPILGGFSQKDGDAIPSDLSNT